MPLTDEQILTAFLEKGTQALAARELGISREAVSQRIRLMRMCGIAVPRLNNNAPVEKYTPAEVRRLNEFIRKTQAAHSRD